MAETSRLALSVLKATGLYSDEALARNAKVGKMNAPVYPLCRTGGYGILFSFLGRSGVMAAAADSKSAVRKYVRVRVPPPAPPESRVRAAWRVFSCWRVAFIIPVHDMPKAAANDTPARRFCKISPPHSQWTV